MASVIVQPPCYVKLDQQTLRDDRGADERDSPLFSLEMDDSLSPGGYRQVSGFRKTSTFFPLHGPARKAALPMIAISAVGWMLFVLSFGIYRNRYMYVGSITDYPELYWAWAACIVGPIAYVLALIHAVMWKNASAAIGSFTALLGMVYTATLGYALITCGIYTYEWVKHRDEEFSEFSVYPEYVGLMFVGSFLAFLFWSLTVALWPWYADGATKASISLADLQEKTAII